MKGLLYILILFTSISYSQDLDYKKMIHFDSLTCERLYKKAKEDMKTEGFRYPSFFYYSRTNLTFKELLKRKYNFIGSVDIGGDVISPSMGCYEKSYIDSISSFYGSNFLDSIREYSDSISEIGKGYFGPKYLKDSVNVFKLLIHKIYDTPVNSDLKDTVRAVYLVFNKAGDIIDRKYFEGKNNIVTPIIEVENKFSKIVFEIIDKSPNWKPAMLEGKPVKSNKLIILHPDYPMDEVDNSF